MEKEKGNGKHLVGILIVLLIVIVGLLVGIFVLKSRDDCLAVSDEEEMRECFLKAYDEDDSEEAARRYNRAVDKALKKEKYELATNLILERAAWLFTKGDCDAVIQTLDDNRIKQLPGENKAYYYSLAASTAECDEEWQEIFDQRLNDLYESGEVDEYGE